MSKIRQKLCKCAESHEGIFGNIFLLKLQSSLNIFFCNASSFHIHIIAWAFVFYGSSIFVQMYGEIRDENFKIVLLLYIIFCVSGS